MAATRSKPLIFERFPAGNIGGFVHPALSNGPWVHLAMPPLVDQEIELNVEGLPRKAKFSSQGMSFVLERNGDVNAEDIGLYVVMVDEDGQRVSSPFIFANVHGDGLVCWGSGNHLPTSLAQAWTTFWTAPFNRDLSVLPPAPSFTEWRRTNGPPPSELKDAPAFTEWIERLEARAMRRILEVIPASMARHMDSVMRVDSGENSRTMNAEYLMPLVQSDYEKLGEKIARLDSIRARIKKRYTAANKTFVPVNDKRYMRIIKERDRLADASRVESGRLISARNNLADFFEYARQLNSNIISPFTIGLFSEDHSKTRRSTVRQIRSYGPAVAVTRCRIFTAVRAYYMDGLTRSLAFKRDMFRQMKRVAELAPLLTTRFLAGVVYLDLIKQLRARAVLSREETLRNEYRAWVSGHHARAYKAHFLDGNWTKALSFERFYRSYEDTYFPPCDGLAFFPRSLAPKLAVIQSRRPVQIESGGVKMSITLGGWAFFTKVKPNVWKLTHPSTSGHYLTNGVRYYHFDPGMDDSAVAQALDEETAHFNPLDLDDQDKASVVVDGKRLFSANILPLQDQITGARPWRAPRPFLTRDAVTRYGPITSETDIVPHRRENPSSPRPNVVYIAEPVDSSDLEGGMNEPIENIREWYEQWIIRGGGEKCVCYQCCYRANRFELYTGITPAGHYFAANGGEPPPPAFAEEPFGGPPYQLNYTPLYSNMDHAMRHTAHVQAEIIAGRHNIGIRPTPNEASSRNSYVQRHHNQRNDLV